MNKFVIDRITSIQRHSITQTPGDEGELLWEADTNKCFIFHNNCWTQISDDFIKADCKQELVPMICKQCGAPLKPNKTDTIRCEYCGTFHFFNIKYKIKENDYERHYYT